MQVYRFSHLKLINLELLHIINMYHYLCWGLLIVAGFKCILCGWKFRYVTVNWLREFPRKSLQFACSKSGVELTQEIGQ